MDREEEIVVKAGLYADEQSEGKNEGIDDFCFEAFIAGAKWADEHPSSSFIVKVWNLATKTAIAQLNGEMPYFKSEKEIQEFINKKLKL